MKKETLIRTFSHIPVLQTERLTLKKMTVDDASDMFEYASNPITTRYLAWEPHPNKTFTYNYLQYLTTRYNAGLFYDFGITITSAHKMIGTCGFTSFRPTSDVGEVGYVINPDYWGRGYAKEALKAVLEFGFEKLHLHRIEAKYIVGNERSRKVMEGVGMTFEGICREGLLVKGQYVSYGVCSILESDYRRLKSINFYS